MKTKMIVLVACCFTLLAPMTFAGTQTEVPAGETAPELQGSASAAPAQAEAPADGPDLGWLIAGVDPLESALATACGTCFEAQQECKASCGGRWVCINYFECDPGDPCAYICNCTATCPPGP